MLYHKDEHFHFGMNYYFKLYNIYGGTSDMIM